MVLLKIPEKRHYFLMCIPVAVCLPVPLVILLTGYLGAMLSISSILSSLIFQYLMWRIFILPVRRSFVLIFIFNIKRTILISWSAKKGTTKKVLKYKK